MDGITTIRRVTAVASREGAATAKRRLEKRMKANARAEAAARNPLPLLPHEVINRCVVRFHQLHHDGSRKLLALGSFLTGGCGRTSTGANHFGDFLALGRNSQFVGVAEVAALGCNF